MEQLGCSVKSTHETLRAIETLNFFQIRIQQITAPDLWYLISPTPIITGHQAITLIGTIIKILYM